MFINLNRFKTSSVAKAISSLFLDFTATNTLDDRVTFSRTSNATVTRSDGTIGYAPHNLLTFSEQFDNAVWVKEASSITANNISAPNGTTTADKIVENTASALHGVRVSLQQVINTVYSASVYVKSAGRTRVQFACFAGSSGNPNSIYDLSTGTIVQQAGGSSGTITSVGDGWYRITEKFTAETTSTNVYAFQIYLVNTGTNNTYTGDGTSGISIWGAQLEVGASPTAYNPTTVKNLLGFSELFDNAAWTKSNSFVQANALTYSEEFDNAAWTKRGTATVTANTTLAPNGYQTADTLTNATDISYASNNLDRAIISLASSTAFTFSIYIKGLTGTTAKLAIRDNSTGTITDSGAITLTSEWQRVSLSRTTGAATTSLSIIIGATNGTVAIWGAQFVQGSVAGDYRRTDAAALPVYYPNHNGVVVAEKLVENTTTSTHEMLLTSAVTVGTNGIYTISFYAKAGERTRFRLIDNSNATNTLAFFDLSNGTVISETVAGSSSITPTGTGWYRVAMKTVPSGTACNPQIRLVSTGTTVSYTGDGTSGIYIFGAQLSDSASLDPYVLTAAAAPTAAAYYGPRFDYDPVTLQPKGLLIEEQRSNLIVYSEQFDNAAWSKSDVSITANNTTSPDGTVDADKLIENTANAYHGAFQSITTSGVLTFSAYFKSAERTHALMFLDSVGVGNCIFNLSNGTFTLTVGGGARIASATMILVGNGWYRCSVTTPSLASAVYYPAVAVSNGSAQYTGNGTSGIFVWGAQLE